MECFILELGTMDDSAEEDESIVDTDTPTFETGARSKLSSIMEKEKSKPSEPTAATTGDDDKDKKDSAFECNICLDVASDAVISMCGHLFCWPCLHQWLETRSVFYFVA
jgi:hypothetical protein